MGVEQLALNGHASQLTGLAFSSDDARLATTSRDGTVRLDALRLEDLIKIARSRLTRSLTEQECQKYLHLDACPPRSESGFRIFYNSLSNRCSSQRTSIANPSVISKYISATML
jgi:WD40 repeat protein